MTVASKPSRFQPRVQGPTRVFLPEGVFDLYSSSDDSQYMCACDDDHCSSQSLSHCYLRHYGKDFNQSLREREAQTFPGPTTENPTSDASSCSDTHSLASSHGTPPDRVAYVVHGSIADEDTVETMASNALERQPHLNEKMRAVLVDWLIELSAEYKLSARTLHLTIALLNRALECGKDTKGGRKIVVEREDFQCLGW